jgi:hypothetical protein
MNKTILVAALLAAVASAHFSISHPIDFIKGKLHKQANGAVTWKNCASDGGFKTDFQNTKSDPLVPVKGQNVNLILQGLFTDDSDLEAIKVYCEWNKTPLYQEEFSRKKHYNEGEILTDKIQWFIPGFAPTGHYTVYLRLHDSGSESDNSRVNFGCIQADFDL